MTCLLARKCIRLRLQAAAVLYARRKRIPAACRLRLVFQPAEEGPGGAKPMIEAGVLDGVDEVRPEPKAADGFPG